jgi:hypothetical protein
MWRSIESSLKFLGALCALSNTLQAEQLPLQTYRTAEGLPHNEINRIVKDFFLVSLPKTVTTVIIEVSQMDVNLRRPLGYCSTVPITAARRKRFPVASFSRHRNSHTEGPFLRFVHLRCPR